MRRRVALPVVIVAGVFLGVAASAGPRLGTWLARGDPLPARVDVGCVLNGEAPARAIEAADLYRRGVFPVIYLPRGAVRQAHLLARRLDLPFLEEQALTMATLRRLGVPASAIVPSSVPAVNTAGEARETESFMAARGMRTVVVVTSPFHLRRSGIIFRRILDPARRVYLHGTRYGDSVPDAWWATHRDRRDVFLEIEKLILGGLPWGGGR